LKFLRENKFDFNKLFSEGIVSDTYFTLMCEYLVLPKVEQEGRSNGEVLALCVGKVANITVVTIHEVLLAFGDSEPTIAGAAHERG
jgi:hypothetical protein